MAQIENMTDDNLKDLTRTYDKMKETNHDVKMKVFDENTKKEDLDQDEKVEDFFKRMLRVNKKRSDDTMKDETFENIFGSKRASYNKTCQLCWDMTLSPVVKDLQHFKDTSIGLWCTDKPEAIPTEKKHLFFRLQ